MARSVLREEFLHADAGISGANLAPADTGSIVLFTNEGNGRMVTTLPKLHIAVLSLEKVIPRFSDLPVFIRLLPRSATGQILSSYVSVVTGVRKTGEATGAEHMHLVLVDNGRSEILQSGFREILKCIRCSACMNVCPVYRIIGGHAYGSTYPGPMGIVLSNLLDGMAVHHELLDASTLCGACVEVCPVRVPLTELIAGLRERKVDYGMADTRERLGMASFGLAAQSPRLFGLGQRLGRAFWPLVQRLDREQVLQRLPAPVARTFGRRNP
jgi:L-lactate dehydrogenase complex protein LldF